MEHKVCVDRKVAHKDCAALACQRCKHAVPESQLKAARKSKKYNDRMRARS